jgi:hypothetical protein
MPVLTAPAAIPPRAMMPAAARCPMAVPTATIFVDRWSLDWPTLLNARERPGVGAEELELEGDVAVSHG